MRMRIASLACAAAGLLGGVFVLAPPAHATLYVSLGVAGFAFTCRDNASCDLDPTTGQISLEDVTLNGVDVTGSFTRSGHTPGATDLLASTSTSLTNHSGSSKSITVAVGDTNFSEPGNSVGTAGSGNFVNNAGNGITMKWYLDNANAQGAVAPSVTPGTLIDSFSFMSTDDGGDPFLHSKTTAFVTGDVFSMTEQWSFTLADNGELNSHGQTVNVPVPEPLSLSLLGSALASAGLVRWRRKRRS